MTGTFSNMEILEINLFPKQIEIIQLVKRPLKLSLLQILELLK